MKRVALVAAGALGFSAVCFVARAALPHSDNDFAPSFLSMLNLSGKPACRGNRDDRQIATRDFVWDGGDSVSIRMPATIRYRRGEGERVTVRARGWVLDHVRLEGGRIDFNCRNMNNLGAVEITLPGVPMKSFALSGAGRLYLEDVQQPELKIALSGATKVEASGQADRASVSIAGFADVDMGHLAARQLDVSIAGSGKVDAAPQDSADISIAGAGQVRLISEPKDLRTHIAGAGQILHGPR